MTIEVRSTRFGDLEVPAERALEFPRGLIGVPGTRYALLATENDDAFVWLQSLEDASFALPVTNPWRFFSSYEVVLSDADAERVGIRSPEEAEVWVTVRAAEELDGFTANLRAPILIADGIGHQVINEAADAPVRAPLFAELASAA